MAIKPIYQRLYKFDTVIKRNQKKDEYYNPITKHAQK